MTGKTKAIDLAALRRTVPPELFVLPRWRSFAKGTLLLAILGAGLALGTSSASILLRACLGVAMGPFIFALASLGHEAGHRTASRWRFLNDLTGVLSMSVIGIPARGWKVKHDLHHQFGGVQGRDTDSEPGLEWYIARGSLVRRFVSTVNRLEFLLWWATAFSLWTTTWWYAIRELARRNRTPAHRRWTAIDLLVAAGFFAGAAVYTWIFGWIDLLLLVALPFVVAGIVGAIAFVPNHRGMPPLDTEQSLRPARYVHVNSRTVLYPPLIPANWFMNYVPWQIEHHIFPTMPGYSLRRLSPYLKEYARREGLSLTYEPIARALPRLLPRRWLWGKSDGRLYTYAEAEAIRRAGATAPRASA